MDSFVVPILYIVFNRPAETSRSFEILRKLQPGNLYIAADGSRSSRTDDSINTAAVRNIVSNIDWDCKVKTLFQSDNLGCRKAVGTALKWFFENEEEGIIIEDDIIPNAAFFEYCKIMLNRYRNDQHIFSINGCSIGYQNTSTPYGLTRYFNMWGWASWRRSFQLVQNTWDKYDPAVSIQNDPQIKAAVRLPVPPGENNKWLKHWQQNFERVYAGKVDTWDYQWMYTAFKTNSYCITPSQNYIVNIGFGETATHHTFTKSPICNLKYTSDTYTDYSNYKPVVDPAFEIVYVAQLVNAVQLKRWRDLLAMLIPEPVKKLIRKKV